MVGKQYQPLPTSDRTVSPIIKCSKSDLFYLTWCLIVGLGGGEKGDPIHIALLLIMFKAKFVDGKHQMRMQLQHYQQNCTEKSESSDKGCNCSSPMSFDFKIRLPINQFHKSKHLSFWGMPRCRGFGSKLISCVTFCTIFVRRK